MHAVPSRLYGCAGELWDPTGRLPDFSYAGYMAGERPIPSLPQPQDSVKSFGAVGDGVTDDTAAIVAAINAATADQPVVYFPPGTYVVSQRIDVYSTVVLQGEG